MPSRPYEPPAVMSTKQLTPEQAEAFRKNESMTSETQRTYVCNHEAKNIAECEFCPEVINMIRTNARLFNIRHIFMKMLKEIGPNYIDYVVNISEEEEEILSLLVEEADEVTP